MPLTHEHATGRTAERHQMLWLLAASPALWSLHFMVCYITAAVWCGKFATAAASLDPARLAIAGYTVVALAAIAVVGGIGFRRHRLGSAELPHDDDSPEDRHRFLGFSTFLLSALSAVAVVYSALAAVFIETCQ
jgi:hypothetical protein